MKIKWTSCADKMPQNDLNYKIITIDELNGLCTDDGKSFNSIKDFCVEFNCVWTTYTPEAWKELRNKKTII